MFPFVVFAFALEASSGYDIWNDIPCYEDYFPDECKPDKISLLTVDAFDKCGPAHLKRVARNYFLGASGRRETYKDNKKAFSRIKIAPKMLRDISRNHINTSVLGFEVDFPIGASPVALQKLAHPDGEIATVNGLSSFQTIMILSNFASTLLEDVCSAANGSALQLWMQLYLYRDREVTLDLVRRAEDSGFKALVVTVDAQVHATLTCDTRHSVLNEGVKIANINASVMGDGDVTDPSATFPDIRWLKQETKLPIIVKGIMNGDDAQQALLAGASAIIVSNHGGRQLDGVQATIDVLPEVVAAVDQLPIVNNLPPYEVYMDGGVRSGNDVFKALALGAKMVFVGRPVIWGLAIGGSDGVKKMMNTLKTEFNQTMLLSGLTNPSEITIEAVLPY